MTLLKTITSVACEYVAQGSNRRHSLINAYAGDIIVKDFPATFPIAFYFELNINFSEKTNVKFEIQLDRKGLGFVEVEVDPDEIEEMSHHLATNLAIVTLPPYPISLEKTGEIRVIASAKGHKNLVILSKKVSKGPI